MLLPHSRSIRTMSGVAVALLALVVLRQPALPGDSDATRGASLQLARYNQSYRSTWKGSGDDSGAESEKPQWQSKRSAPIKGSGGGYNPERIQRFWSHYHGATRPPKEKPLERQPRGDEK